MPINGRRRMRETRPLRWERNISLIGDVLFVFQMCFEVCVAVVVGTLSMFLLILRLFRQPKKEPSVVWVIGASSGIGNGSPQCKSKLKIELAIEYATQGKNVILSSRSFPKLEALRDELVTLSGRDMSCFPILPVDIEKDESFKNIVSVILYKLIHL